MNITSLGSLTLSNATLVAGAILLEKAFYITGSCTFASVAIQGFRFPLSWVNGRLFLAEVTIADASAVTVLLVGEGTEVSCYSVQVMRLSSPFLITERAEFQRHPFKVTITESLFANNRISGALFHIWRTYGDIDFLSSEFHSNSGTFLYVDSQQSRISWKDSSYHDNNGTMLSGFLQSSEVVLDSSEFADVSQPLVALSQFTGHFHFVNSTLTRHLSPILLSIVGSGTDKSLVYFTNSTISDSNVTITTPIDGGLAFYSCLIHFSAVHISNVTRKADYFKQLNSLVYIRLGQVWMSGLRADYAGSSSFFMGVMVGDFHLQDFSFEHLYTGAGMFVQVVNGQVWLRDGHVAMAEYLRMKEVGPFFEGAIAFGMSVCKADIANVRIGESKKYFGGGIVLYYSTFTITNWTTVGVLLATTLASMESSGSVSDTTFRNLISVWNVVLATRGAVTFSNLTVTNVKLEIGQTYALFAFFGQCEIWMEGVKVRNLTAEAFLRTKSSRIHMKTVSIAESWLGLVLHYPLNSSISLQDFSLSNSVTKLAQMSKATVSLENAYIHDIVAYGTLMGGYGSTFSLKNVTFRRVEVRARFGTFSEQSRMSFERVQVSELSAQEGMEMKESSLLITYSLFSSFYFALFQGITSNITISFTSFHQGVSYPLSLSSQTAFGAVLGCLDCPYISLYQCEVRNVSTRFGGVLAARRSVSAAPLFVSMVDSRFEACSATIGGALFLQNISFAISFCSFYGNSADRAGGALFAAIKSSNYGMVVNSTFMRNKAVEGGAVKWSNAEVLFIGTNFQENLAEYGPDIASYGVELTSSLTNLTGQEASGFPLTLVFELRDHYHRRVTLSPFRSLKLTSTAAVSYRGNQVSILSYGLFNYSDLIIYAAPASTQLITSQLSDSQEDFLLEIHGSVTVPFRNCSPGEVHLADRCEFCYTGNYSFSPQDSNCSFCPANAFCPGGYELHANPGYWRNGINSAKLFQCPFLTNCHGGQNSSCASGYDGPLCNQCAQEAYRQRATECTLCSNIAVHVLQLVSALLLSVLFAWLILRYAVHYPNYNKLFVLKTVLNHFQFLSILSYLRLSYAPVITSALHAVMYVSSALVPDLPLGCFRVQHSEYIKGIIGSALLPVYSLAYLLICLLGRASWRRSALVLYTSSMLYLPFVTVQTTFPLLSCWKLDSEDLLFWDLRVKCWEGTHLLLIYAFLLPSAILCVLGPFVMVLVCYYCKRNVFKSCFVLWSPLWDLFVLLSKCVIVGIVQVTVSSSSLVQVTYFLTCFISLNCAIVSASTWTFSTGKQLILSQASALSTTLCAGFLSYYLYSSPGMGNSEGFVIGMVLLLNCTFLVLAVLTLRYDSNLNASLSSISEGPHAPAPSSIGSISEVFS